MIIFSRIPVVRIKSIQKSSIRNILIPTVEFSTCLTDLLHFLALSVEKRSVRLIQQSHAKSHCFGLAKHPLIAQKLVFLYCDFKKPADALLVFESLSVKILHICNTLLGGYGKNHLFLESFELFREMCRVDTLPLADSFTFSMIFKTLGDYGEVVQGEMIQARGFTNGLLLDTVVANSLISMYCKCGSFRNALKVFDDMPHRNGSSWNTIISSYTKLNFENVGKSFDKLSLWDLAKGMQDDGLKLDAYTISTLLSFEGGHSQNDQSERFSHGKELHCYIVKNWLDLNPVLGSDVHLGCCLIDMYSKSRRTDASRKVFDRLKRKNIYVWTAMITGYVQCGDYNEAFFLFREMQWRDGVEPNMVSLVTILPACSSYSGLMSGKQIHGFAVRREVNQETSLCNALIDMYSKCGNLSYSISVFEYGCIDKNVISWNSMISGYGLHGQGQQAVILFDKMLQTGIRPDASAVVGVLSACCRSGLVNDGIRLYDCVVNDYGVQPTMEMSSCMVHMLGLSGQFDRALNFIKTMPMEAGPSVWGSFMSASVLHRNFDMADLAYKSLVKLEPENSSNYISLSNFYASSKRWDVVSKLRNAMHDRGLRKFPGCSWIIINGTTHSFFVSDESHPHSELVYALLDQLVSTMKLTHYIAEY